MTPSLHDPLELTPNFAHVLWRTARQSGSAPAIEDRDGTTDYRELAARAGAIAAELIGRGLQPGGRVGIFLDRGAEAAAAFFGTLAAGGVAVIINETLRARQIEHILSHSGAGILLTSAEMLAKQPRMLETAGEILDVGSISRSERVEPVARLGNDVAQIIYTSGSTGLPKGVTLAHRNLWAGMWAVTSYVGITAEDRIASLLPFSFDYGLNQLFCAVGTGATLVVERSPLPQQIAVSLKRRRVTVLPCVPPLWMQLLGTSGFTEGPIPSLRAMTNTGGRVPTEAVRRLRTAQPHARLFLMYGLTEAFRATYLPPDEVDRRPDSIGRAIPGSEILVLREDLTPCDPGEVGELVQRGPTVALGYWNDPAATERVYRSNPLRPEGTPEAERVVFSGDLVRRDDDGFLYFVGRRDQMIKTLGFRVSPDEIVNVLYDSGEITEAVVGTVDDPTRGSRIVAFVVLAAQGSTERLAEFCRVELPRYMQPSEFVACTELPRTSSGKYDPRALTTAGSPSPAATGEREPRS